MRKIVTVALASIAAWPMAAAWAVEADTYDLTIQDHRFSPDRIEVPAGRKIVLVVKNQDAQPEEFESGDLKREKVVKGNRQVRVQVGPLAAGEYKFSGEYHADTAQGVLVAK